MNADKWGVRKILGLVFVNIEDGRRETEDGRQKTGDGRRKTGDRRRRWKMVERRPKKEAVGPCKIPPVDY
jgi:hypothetical protein